MNRLTALTTIVVLTLFATACGGELGTPINSGNQSTNNASTSSTNNASTSSANNSGTSSGNNASTSSANNSSTSSGNNASTSSANNSCVPATEVCDGEDNDCDGEVDEDFAVGSTCSVGQGECAVEATTVCNEAGDGVVCGVEPREAIDEVCGDNLDNDCDGEVDEGFEDVGEECTEGIGVCAQTGVMVCSEDGTSTVCGVEALAPPEVDEISCDGEDNDCDGVADEGCDGDGDEWCAAGFLALAGGPCTAGEGDCDDTNADIFPGSTIPGCDGADNDCDGDSDEVELVPGSDATAPLLINIDDTDASGGPGLLVAPMPGDRFCGAVSYNGTATIQLFFFRTSGPAIDVAGSVPANDVRLIDIVAETHTCTLLFGYDDGGTDRIALVRATVGSPTLDGPTNVSNDEVFLSTVWSGALRPTSGSSYRVLGLPTGAGGQARLYVRTMAFSKSTDDGATVLIQHVAMAPDTSGSNFDDFIMGTRFGQSRHWITDLPNFDLIDPWSTSFSMDYPDIEQVGATTFQAGVDGSTLHVRTPKYDSNQMAYVVEAAGTQSTTSDRDYMTRHQLFEGAGGTAYVIDAAADEVYGLTVNGGTISFDRVDTSLLATGSQVVAGKSLGPDTMQILTLERPPSNAVDFTAWTAGCF